MRSAAQAIAVEVHSARCSDLEELLSGWEPERHAEIRKIVDQLARSLGDEIPRPATRS
jgi:hypothetical protein